GIQDPPVMGRKGRPRTQRLTGPTEGRARGGGAGIQVHGSTQDEPRRQNRCSRCHQPGHNRTKCPRET
ncbi:hypothetical protein C8R46DRAFT_902172, partial [Mycena filopes]